MRWKVVLVVGLLVSAALFAAAIATGPPYADVPVPALPLYLAWAAIGVVGITLALAWLVVVETSAETARAVVILACTVAFVAVGEGAIYVDRHPGQERICVPSGCGSQLNRPEAANRATELFIGGSAIVAAMGAAALVAIRRSRPEARAA
jgi:hypothetical protein